MKEPNVRIKAARAFEPPLDVPQGAATYLQR